MRNSKGHKVRLVGLVGLCGWSMVQWIMGVVSFQKMYGLFGLKHHLVEISGDGTDAGRTEEQTTREESATQILICE